MSPSTPSSAESPVQAAVYARLANDPILGGLAERISDGLPEGVVARAHVVISVTAENRDRRLQDGAGQHAARLLLSVASHVEDTQGRTGNRDVQAMNSRVIELLDSATLVVAGWTFVSCDHAGTTPQQDGAWRTRTADFDFLVENR